METDLYGNRTWITEEEYKQELKEKREKIKSAPEYYGTGAPSKKRDYINYKNFLKSKLKKMNRQEKIDAIYEKIADKIPTLGCKTEVYSRDDIIISYYNKKLTFLNDENGIEVVENYEPLLIGHPVMIGDVMDYLFKKENTLSNDGILTPEVFQLLEGNGGFGDFYWQEKRKPIEDQSDECVDFVFDLIY